MIDEPDGLLPILNLDDQTSWDHVLEIANPHLTREGLHRLRNALVETAKSIIVEHHYIDRDYRNTFSHFYSKRFIVPDSRCIRLHFFDVAVDRATLFDDSERLNSHYLGYSVIRPTRPNCIGRTLLKPTSRLSARGTMCICSEKISIQGAEFIVEGFPFISQDADVTVCAQAALWMLARYYSDRYPFYPEVYPVEIVNLTRDYSVGRLLPTSGLRVWQLAEALRRMRFSPLIYARDIYNDSFEHLLYTHIESGIPVLAALRDHVVVLFGHVSDFSGISNICAAVDGKPFSQRCPVTIRDSPTALAVAGAHRAQGRLARGKSV
jgi:hypothetical protein